MKQYIYLFTGMIFTAGVLGHMMYHPTMESYCGDMEMEVRVDTTSFTKANVVLQCRGNTSTHDVILTHVYNPATAKARNTLTNES